MSLDILRNQVSEFLGFDQTDEAVSFETLEISEEATYTRVRITYISQEGDQIPAFLLLPRVEGPLGAVLIHHQQQPEASRKE
jgi:hypothetical protein